MGTVGSLVDHGWDWGDNDSLGYSTLYVRDDTGDPDTSGVLIEPSQRNHACTLETTGHTIQYIRFCQGQADYGGGSIWSDSGSYATIQNCELCQGYTSVFNYYHASTDSGAFVIQDNEVWDTGGNGIQLANHATGFLIRRNDVHDFALLDEVSDHDYSAGIKLNAATGCTIEKNHVYDGGGGGTDAGGGVWCDTSSTSDIVRLNRIHDLIYQGVRIEENSDSCEVYNNVIYGCNAAGYVGGIFVCRYVHSTKVYNNTIYGCTYNMMVQGEYPVQAGSCTNNIIKNNLTWGSTTAELLCYDGGENDGTYGSGNVYVNNHFQEKTGFVEWGRGNAYNTISAWETAVGDSAEVGDNQTGDPSFTNAGAGNFTLQSDSPCIGAGVDLGASYADALMPSSTWPDGVVTGDQDDY